MPFPQPHYLLALGGPLRNNEQWSMSCRLRIQGAWDPASGAPDGKAGEEAALASIVAALDTWRVGQNATIGSDALFEWAKLNLIGQDGRYVRGYTNLIEKTPPVAFGSGTSPYPNQIALVVTLGTALQRGLASKGRMFWPVPRHPLDANGRIASTGVSAATNSAKTFVDAVNAAVPNLRMAVVSNTREGAINNVTRIGVGQVYDTMRSRRAQLLEDMSYTNVAAPPS